MPRPRRDGTPAREARKQKLPDRFVRTIKAESAAFAVWDTYQRGLACRVQPTGQKSWKAVYSRGGVHPQCAMIQADSLRVKKPVANVLPDPPLPK